MADLIKETGKQLYKCSLGEDNDEVIIGDEKSASTFKPQITFSRWNKENFLTIKLPDNLMTSAIPTVKDTKTLEMGDSKTGFYFNRADDENFKFGLILYEKPATNTWSFQLEGAEQFILDKRPELNKDNGDGTKTWNYGGGVNEWANSYRLYKKEIVITNTPLETLTSEKYGLHFISILRPKFIDAKDDWIWADLGLKGSDYIITVSQAFLDKAVYPIRVNDSITYQQGVSPDASYAGCDDTSIRGTNNPDTNYGTTSPNLTSSKYTAWASAGLVKFDVSTIPAGSTINTADLSLYFESVDDVAYTAAVWRVFKPWTEAGATGNHWDGTNGWTTQLCQSADDAGSENTGDHSGADRTATAEATKTVAAWTAAGWRVFSIITAVDAWVQGTWSNYGLKVWYTTTNNVTDQGFTSAEGVTTANRPKLAITYTPSGGAAVTGIMTTRSRFWGDLVLLIGSMLTWIYRTVLN